VERCLIGIGITNYEISNNETKISGSSEYLRTGLVAFVSSFEFLSFVIVSLFEISLFVIEDFMTHRIFNFSAGPAMLPTEVLEKSAAALLDFQGKGFGIGEVSHRGKDFEGVNDEAMSRCKSLLGAGGFA